MAFSLYNSSSDALIDSSLTNGETVSGDFTIVATPNQPVGSAVFSINGEKTQTENVAPYALFGDANGDFAGGSLTPGVHTVEVEYFTGRNGKGASLGTESVSFTVASAEEPVPPSGSLADWADHIIAHFDGNNNDWDDIAAMPVAALLSAAGGIADKMTFAYGNNVSERNNDTQLARLDDSADFARTLGIDTRGYQDDIEGTTEHLVSILSSGENVLMIEGGPMETAYRALERTDEKYHENVILVSHSSWNENRDVISAPGITEARTWDDIIRDFDGVTTIEIEDQNDGNNNDKGFNNAAWSWMDDSDEPLIQEARAAMEGASAGGNTRKQNDPSDAGMIFYALTGNADGTPQDVQAYLEASGLYDLDPPADPTPPGDDPSDPPPAPDPDDFDVTFSVYNADTDTLTDAEVTDGDTISGEALTIVATPNQDVGSATFWLDDKEIRTENVAPYALFGNIEDDFFKGGLGVGEHAVYVEFYAGEKGTGALLGADSMTFTVADAPDQPEPPEPPKPEPDPDPDEPADPPAPLEITFSAFNPQNQDEIDDDLMDREAIPENSSIVATPSAPVGSAVFSLNGKAVQTENVVPYALFGDKRGDLRMGDLPAGEHVLEVAFYEGKNGKGALLGSDSVILNVEDAADDEPPAPTPPEPEPNPVPVPDPVPDPDPVPPPSVDPGVFLAQDGTLVIEAESADPEGYWRPVKVEGEDALLWDAPSSSYRNVPDGETLSYEFLVDEDGTYFAALHSARIKSTMNNSDRYHNGKDASDGERTDTGNDAYVSVVNVETGDVVQDPIKLFTGLGGADRTLKFGTTFDANHKKSAASFDLEADVLYRLEITGRSDGYVLESLVLNEGKRLLDDDLPESPRTTEDWMPSLTSAGDWIDAI